MRGCLDRPAGTQGEDGRAGPRAVGRRGPAPRRTRWENSRGTTPNASHKKTPVVKYLLAHAVSCAALICVSPVFYRSYAAHTAFVCALLCCSVWNGARRYYWIMTKGYEKRLRALLPPERARGEREEKEE